MNVFKILRKFSLLHTYHQYIKQNNYNIDQQQINLLQMLQTNLNYIRQEHPKWKTFVQNIRQNQQIKNTIFQSKAKGFYIFGNPGTGKTFLLDLFFQHVPFQQKLRIHFNEFMLILNQQMYFLRNVDDQIVHLSNRRAKKYRIICLDQFQVTNIADAMIIRRFVQKIIPSQTILIFTTNRHPQDLYKNGLQRKQHFQPFIPFLTQNLIVHSLKSPIDYRETFKKSILKQTYHYPLNEKAEQNLLEIYSTLTQTIEFFEKTISVIEGRQLTLKKTAKGVAYFQINDLIKQDYGPSDFMAIARNFHTIIVTGVKPLTIQQPDEMRRFILFVEQVYNNRTKLYLSAERSVEQTFPSYDKNKQQQCDQQFAIDRCRSRIVEMQSEHYLEQKSWYMKKRYKR